MVDHVKTVLLIKENSDRVFDVHWPDFNPLSIELILLVINASKHNPLAFRIQKFEREYLIFLRFVRRLQLFENQGIFVSLLYEDDFLIFVEANGHQRTSCRTKFLVFVNIECLVGSKSLESNNYFASFFKLFRITLEIVTFLHLDVLPIMSAKNFGDLLRIIFAYLEARSCRGFTIN